MSLVAIACPQSETEVACMLCELEAAGITTFVQGAGIGSLLPGPQISTYNARRIMVSSSDADAAREVLAKFYAPAAPQGKPWRPGFPSMIRMFLELVFFAWFVPAKKRRGPSAEDGHD